MVFALWRHGQQPPNPNADHAPKGNRSRV